MKLEQIEDVFDRMGYYHLRDKLSYKIWLNGILNDEDGEDLLEAFLDAHRFEDDSELFYDTFIYQLKIFKCTIHFYDLPYFS